MAMKISIPASLLMPGSVGRQTIGSLGSSEDSTNGSLKKPTFSERHPKVVRSLTVVGYIFAVSLAAIVLSAYYVFIWYPKPTQESHKSGAANTTNLPCRGVSYLPGEGGVGVEVPYNQFQRVPINSRYMYSKFRAVHRPPSSVTRRPPFHHNPQQPSASNFDYSYAPQHDPPRHEHEHNRHNTHSQRSLSYGKGASSALLKNIITSHGESSIKMKVSPAVFPAVSDVGTNHLFEEELSAEASAPNSAPTTPHSIILRKIISHRKNVSESELQKLSQTFR